MTLNYYLDKPKSEGETLYPIALYPKHLDDRMSAQQACFIMFGNVVNGLNFADYTENILDNIYIASDSKKKILKELQLLGMNHYTVFPDLDGLGRAINEESYPRFANHKENDSIKNMLS